MENCMANSTVSRIAFSGDDLPQQGGIATLTTIVQQHVSPEKIDLIPHSIPDVPFVDPSFTKDLFGVVTRHCFVS